MGLDQKGGWDVVENEVAGTLRWEKTNSQPVRPPQGVTEAQKATVLPKTDAAGAGRVHTPKLADALGGGPSCRAQQGRTPTGIPGTGCPARPQRRPRRRDLRVGVAHTPAGGAGAPRLRSQDALALLPVLLAPREGVSAGRRGQTRVLPGRSSLPAHRALPQQLSPGLNASE